MKFKNKQLEKKFLRNGYVILEIYSNDEISLLKKLYNLNEDKYAIVEKGNYSTCDTNNAKLIKQIDAEIKSIISNKLDNYFESYDYLLSSFLTKTIGQNNETVFHHDPTMIDYKNNDNISAGLWCPLQQTNKKNGCLRVIKGSHRIGNILSVTPNFTTFFNTFDSKLYKFATPIKLKVGQGVLFNNKLVHGAFSNLSDKKRVATVTAIKSSNCDWCYYYKPTEKNLVEKYIIDYESYVQHIQGNIPKGELVEKFNYNFEKKSYSQFLAFMFKNYPLETVRNIIFN